MTSPRHLFGQLMESLRGSKRVLLVAHKKPDGDTTGSSSAMLNWLLREGKDVTAFCRDPIPSTFRYIDNIHRYTNDPAVFDQPYDVVIIFDSGELAYCGVAEYIPKLPKPYLLVNIDHHITNTNFGDINIVITTASSTAEIVYRLFDESQTRIDDRMATSLLTGLYTDTSNFSNAATTTIAMDAASRLIASGARVRDVNIHTLHDKSVTSLKIWGTLLSRLRHNVEAGVVSTYLLRSDSELIGNDIIEGVANFLNAVTAGADTILFLRELPNGTVKGSLRSTTKNVSAIAKLLGGGGHVLASGFTIPGKIEETPTGPRIVSI